MRYKLKVIDLDGGVLWLNAIACSGALRYLSLSSEEEDAMYVKEEHTENFKVELMKKLKCSDIILVGVTNEDD